MFNDGRMVKQLSMTPLRNQTNDVMGVVAVVADDTSTETATDFLQRSGNI